MAYDVGSSPAEDEEDEENDVVFDDDAKDVDALDDQKMGKSAPTSAAAVYSKKLSIVLDVDHETTLEIPKKKRLILYKSMLRCLMKCSDIDPTMRGVKVILERVIAGSDDMHLMIVGEDEAAVNEMAKHILDATKRVRQVTAMGAVQDLPVRSKLQATTQ